MVINKQCITSTETSAPLSEGIIFWMEQLWCSSTPTRLSDLVTREVDDFDYGVAEADTKLPFKIALAVSSTSHDRGDRVTRLIKTKTATARRLTLVSH